MISYILNNIYFYEQRYAVRPFKDSFSIAVLCVSVVLYVATDLSVSDPQCLLFRSPGKAVLYHLPEKLP